MRKTYNKPEIILVKVQAAHMIAATGDPVAPTMSGKDATGAGMTKERNDDLNGGIGSLW